jgi:RNA polymerase-binding protein DksA
MPRASDENANREMLSNLRRALELKRDDLSSRLSASQAEVHLPEGPLDFGDCCQKNHDEWLFVNRNRVEAGLLRDIRHALRRLDNGTYGTCQECGGTISARRLEAVPWATCCVACQERVSSRC